MTQSAKEGLVNANTLREDLVGHTIIVDPAQAHDFELVYGMRYEVTAEDSFTVTAASHQSTRLETKAEMVGNSQFFHFTGRKVPYDLTHMEATCDRNGAKISGAASRFLVKKIFVTFMFFVVRNCIYTASSAGFRS